ncbi:MAG: porin [Alphaproteobacteria bacterium]
MSSLLKYFAVPDAISASQLRRRLAAALICALAAAPGAVHAADAQTDARIRALEQQIDLLRAQVQDLKVSEASKYAEAKRSRDSMMENGRPTIRSADGKYTASLRSLVQFDAAHYIQQHAPAGSDLATATNFRRARIGVEGVLEKVFDYSFIYDFGGSGVEGSTISAAYVQYSALKPFAIRLGAFAPFASLEDSGGAGDTIFMERASAVELARGLAGGDGRSAVAVSMIGDRYFSSLALTGARVGQSGSFDEQQGLVGRVAGLIYTNPAANANIVLGGNVSHIFEPADSNAGSSDIPAATIFSNPPELRVDNTGANGASASLISTGAIIADTVTQWGLDGAAQWKNLYAEGGYFHFSADRRGAGLAGSDPEFSGWYAQTSWLLTGENRRYDPARAAFRAPKVAAPFTGLADSGWGVWEVAARYSVLDLNEQTSRSTANGGIRGGEQDIWTFGANWYPNNALRFSLNYLLIDIDRLAQGTTPPFPDISQKDQALALRSQVSF